MTAGAAARRFAAVRGTLEPRGHAPGNQPVADAEQAGLMITQIRVRCGVSAEPLEGSVLRAVHFHPSSRSKYVKFSRHKNKRQRLQNTKSKHNANTKKAETQGFYASPRTSSRDAHAKRVNLTQHERKPQMTALIYAEGSAKNGKACIASALTPTKVTKLSRFGHPLVTRVTGNLQPSPKTMRRLNCNKIHAVMGRV
jgi:hypothetical protein